jgi:hypothetical protein
MKTIITLLFFALLAFILYNRQRIYVRDPIATVYRNNLPESGTAVYINFSNDVLLQHGDDSDARRILLQNTTRFPGTPERLTCLRWTACMAESDEAPSIPLEATGKGKYDPKVFMTSREVSFVEPDGTPIRIELR